MESRVSVRWRSALVYYMQKFVMFSRGLPDWCKARCDSHQGVVLLVGALMFAGWPDCQMKQRTKSSTGKKE